MSSDGKVGDDGLKLSSDSVGYVTGLLQQIAELQKNLEQTELKLGAVQVQRDMLNRLCQETQTVNNNLVDTNCSFRDQIRALEAEIRDGADADDADADAKAAKETAKEATKEAAKEAAKETAKEAAKAKVECNGCSKTFENKAALFAHLGKVGYHKAKVKCNGCPETFENKTALFAHLANVGYHKNSAGGAGGAGGPA